MDKFICKHCGKELGNANFITFAKSFHTILPNGISVLFCDEACYEKYKKQYEVDVYNGEPIYMVHVDGKDVYLPYFESPYYFTNIEDCKRRMDMKTVGIYLGGEII